MRENIKLLQDNDTGNRGKVIVKEAIDKLVGFGKYKNFYEKYLLISPTKKYLEKAFKIYKTFKDACDAPMDSMMQGDTYTAEEVDQIILDYEKVKSEESFDENNLLTISNTVNNIFFEIEKYIDYNKIGEEVRDSMRIFAYGVCIRAVANMLIERDTEKLLESDKT